MGEKRFRLSIENRFRQIYKRPKFLIIFIHKSLIKTLHSVNTFSDLWKLSYVQT